MNKKTFRASNIQQAIANIKQELGPEAMILNTKKIPKKPLDPYGKLMFEVEAALPSDFPDTSCAKFPLPTEPQHSRQPSGYEFEADSAMDHIRSDIADIRDLISVAGFGRSMPHLIKNYTDSVGVLASLLRAGISDALAGDIVTAASEDALTRPESGERGRVLRKHVMRQCLERIETKDFFTRSNHSGVPHVAAFVGPTGVGKTTTIAKLAAMLTFERKMKVGLISIDNYRVGAFEQLKAYASIMGLICVPAFSRQDLSCALDRMRSMDMVLIDTAGHSHFDKVKIDEILELIRSDFRISTHLVLSVTSESTIMKDAASAFSAFRPDTVVFTKIDEIKRCGKILDHLSDIQLPVSLVTDGQRVPEDLIVPSRQQLLKIILRKGSKERGDLGPGKRTSQSS